MPIDVMALTEPEDSIGYQAKRVHHAVVAALGPLLESEGLTYTQWSVLASLHFEHGRTCAELARVCSHDKGAMSRLIDVMEQKNWVTRKRAPDDRRSIILSLTREGEALARRGHGRVTNCWSAWLSGWDDADVRHLTSQLRLLRTIIEGTAFPVEGAAEEQNASIANISSGSTDVGQVE